MIEYAVVNNNTVEGLNIPLDKESFVSTLIGELAEIIETLVGVEEASGFITMVGESVGQRINKAYKEALATHQLTAEQVASVLIDLKKRIHGDFYLISLDEEKIVLGNRHCPFGNNVSGRPSLCMMTSSVFGNIVSDNLGYSRITLEKTIAQGHDECLVTVYLQPHNQGFRGTGIEYFKK